MNRSPLSFLRSARRTLVLASVASLLIASGASASSPATSRTSTPGASSGSARPTSTAAPRSSTTGAAAAQRATPASQARRFPTLDLSRLSPDEQATFLRIVDSELCPCEGAVISLGECLEAPNATCGLAREATMRLNRGLMRGESERVISAGIAQTVREASTVHNFDLRDVPYQGAANPKVTMVTFADFECPYCREMARITEDLVKEYPKDLRVYFMNFPLSGHRNAGEAALAALAAHKQGKFWPYHDLLFANQAALGRAMDPMPLFEDWARSLGLDIVRFQADMADGALYDRVQGERRAAQAAGASGTPTVYLNGTRMLDIDSTAAIRARIDRLIREASR